MLVYTYDNKVKLALLNKNQELVCEKVIDGKNVYVFRIDNPSFIKKFSNENDERIFVFNNKMNF